MTAQAGRKKTRPATYQDVLDAPPHAELVILVGREADAWLSAGQTFDLDPKANFIFQSCLQIPVNVVRFDTFHNVSESEKVFAHQLDCRLLYFCIVLGICVPSSCGTSPEPSPDQRAGIIDDRLAFWLVRIPDVGLTHHAFPASRNRECPSINRKQHSVFRLHSESISADSIALVYRRCLVEVLIDTVDGCILVPANHEAPSPRCRCGPDDQYTVNGIGIVVDKPPQTVLGDLLEVDGFARRLDIAIHGALMIEEIAYFRTMFVLIHKSPATGYCFTTLLTAIQFHSPNIAEQNTHFGISPVLSDRRTSAAQKIVKQRNREIHFAVTRAVDHSLPDDAGASRS